MRNRNRRGSAMLFVVVLMFAITTVILATHSLTVSADETETRYEDEVKARFALDAAVASAEAEWQSGTLSSFPATRSVTVDGKSVSVSISDYSGTVDRTMKVTATLTLHGRSYSYSKVVGTRINPSMWNYAVFAGSSISGSGTLTTGSAGANGDVYFTGSPPSMGGTCTINGRLETAGESANACWTTNGGSLWTSAPSLTFRSVSAFNYLTSATVILTTTSMSGRSFVSAFGAPYQIVYVSNDCDIKGNFTGNGTVFVNGRMRINGNITASGNVMFIASGEIEWRDAATSVQGFFYSQNRFFTTGSHARTLNTGGIVADTVQIDSPVTVIHAPTIWNSTDEGVKMHAPGLWP